MYDAVFKRSEPIPADFLRARYIYRDLDVSTVETKLDRSVTRSA